MDSTLPVSASQPPRAEKIAGEGMLPKQKRDLAVKDPALLHVQTMKDAKRAELQGEYIPISEEQLIKAIERAIKSMEGSMTALDFSIHERTKQVMVKVINKDTGEVIREIPPEKNLDFLAKVWEKCGILVDEKR